jgi:hypothetical protein
MSPEEFMNAVPPDLPARAASRLDPHRAAIDKLRASGYSLRQICVYLEKCGVSVSFQRLSKYLRPQLDALQLPESEPPPPPSAAPGTKSREDIARENPGLSKKRVDEIYLDQFEKRPQNPLLRRTKKP